MPVDEQSHLKHVAVPDGMAPGFGYSHVVSGSGHLIMISGQVLFDKDGKIVGNGDIEAQTRQVFEKMQRCFLAAGASFREVVKTDLLRHGYAAPAGHAHHPRRVHRHGASSGQHGGPGSGSGISRVTPIALDCTSATRYP